MKLIEKQQIPKESGWYWYREKHSTQYQVLHVREDGFIDGYPIMYHKGSLNGFWAGPIPLPTGSDTEDIPPMTNLRLHSEET